jgi:Domain of unknown function (DUF4440)
MKKIIITFVFSCLIINILQAQSSFDEVTFNGMMARLQTDRAFIKNETDPGFTIIFSNGSISSKESLLKFFESNVGFYKRIESNLKVRQVGNSAIVTGVSDESFLSKTNAGVVDRSDKVVFTYIFSQQNGKWLWVSGQHTDFKKPAFTAATLNELVNEYKKDSKAFFNNRLSEDFKYINRKGGFQPQKDFLGGTAQNIVSTEMLDPVIFQSGDLAVTSGIHKTVRIDKDGKEITENTAVTYTWQRRNDKWMFVGSQQSTIQAPVAEDEMAIRQICENETKYFHEADAKNWDSQWSDKGYAEYNSQYLKELIKTPFAKGEMLVGLKNNVAKTLKPDGLVSKTSDFEARINGNMAWVTYTQEDFKGETSTAKSRQLRILEKANGSWKIVCLSIQNL